MKWHIYPHIRGWASKNSGELNWWRGHLCVPCTVMNSKLNNKSYLKTGACLANPTFLNIGKSVIPVPSDSYNLTKLLASCLLITYGHFFFQYKYQINIDGTVAAYRLPYLLAGNSVVLKQDSIYYEHFYNELQPWKHYIPFKSDLSDLLEKLQWAKEHDEEVKYTFRSTQQCFLTK